MANQLQVRMYCTSSPPTLLSPFPPFHPPLPLQAKPVWSLEGRGLTAMAASERLGEVAIGAEDGSIVLWDCRQWQEVAKLASGGGAVMRLQYGGTNCSQLPRVFLLVRAQFLIEHMPYCLPPLAI